MTTDNLKYQHYNICCKTLTPIHIGSGEILASIGDYYVGSNKLYYIDKEKLDRRLESINDEEFLNDYVNEIKKNVNLSKSDFSIVTFLKNKGVELSEITSDHEIPILSENYDSHRNSQLKLAIKQKQKLYFPGSSIKGALKTVLFYSFVKNNPDTLNRWKKLIFDSDKKSVYNSHWIKDIENVFNGFMKGEKSDYNLLRINDTGIFDDRYVGIWKACRFHFYNKNEEMLEWLFEGIKSDTSFNLEITLLPEFKTDFLKCFNKNDIANLFKLCNDFSKKQLEIEIDEINKSSLSKDGKEKILSNLKQLLELTNSQGQAILRIGAGKSFFYNTISSLLDKEHFEKLRGMIKIGKTEESTFPLSRTFTSEYESPGWILLEMPKEKEIELPVNTVEKIEINETILKAVILGNKKVAININSKVLDNVQLVLTNFQKALELKKGDGLEVFVKEMSKDGRITMVGIKD